MRAQDQRVVRAEIAHQALLLLALDRRAFVVVVPGMPIEADRGLADRQQSALHGGDRHAGARMRVNHAAHVGPRAMDCPMNDVAGLVDVVIGVGLPDDVAIEVDFGKARGGDLFVQQTVQIDQDVVLRARHAHRDVVVREVRHAVVIDQAIAGGKFDTRLPFLGAHFVTDAAKVGSVVR